MAANTTTIAIAALALVVSGLAACFTWQQVEVARDTASRELRAYVYAVPGRVFHIDGESGSLQAYVGIKNSGQTFAHDVERSVGVSVFGSEIPDEVSSLMVRERGKFVIGPNGSHVFYRNGDKLTPVEAKQVRKLDGKRIYVIGTIAYRDVWGKSHTTDFCFMYYGAEDEAHPTLGMGRFYQGWQGKYCDKHNKAD